ncbi:MAG: hypothetical protein HN370_07970 [Phycisphaerales bacterium]|nr:hypothetical protein [Phycisphaerales bacterium]
MRRKLISWSTLLLVAGAVAAMLLLSPGCTAEGEALSHQEQEDVRQQREADFDQDRSDALSVRKDDEKKEKAPIESKSDYIEKKAQKRAPRDEKRKKQTRRNRLFLLGEKPLANKSQVVERFCLR